MIRIAEKDHFPDILDRVHLAAPELDEGAARHAGNLIARHIRRSRTDCYGIEVSKSPMDVHGYCRLFQVEASGIVLHVRAMVD